jgi:uncharacterized protein involved in type VI secretion and phage assembly
MTGVAVGLVSEVDAKLGRVKVKFPWLDDISSFWAPIASLLSGNKRGARFMPEIDDEALIAFDHGSIDHPYAIGFLWNGKDEAPDDVKFNRVIVTPGGHELRFEDKEGDRRTVLKTADDHRLAMDDKERSITLESKEGHKLEILDSSGKVTLTTKNGGKVTIDDQPGKVEIEASQNKITIGPSGVTVDVTAGTLNIKSAAATNVEASGMMTVKSSAAMNVQSSAMMTIQSTAVMNITSSAAMTVMSSAAMSIQAGAAVNLTAALLNVNAAMANFSGVVNAQVVRAQVISGSAYTPGAGNLV